MACHEIAALRIAMMNLLGIDDPVELAHETAELGDALDAPGPIASLARARSFAEARSLFSHSVAALDEKIALTPKDDPSLAYLRTLGVLVRKVELDLASRVALFESLFRDLETVHDYVHELYPAED
jgi:hypothetical protein